jgi:cytochrome c-type biogenesis protein CcmH/NrfG
MQAPESQTELMRPALLLKEVITVDSNNLDALYYLGKLSIETNQFEKAIERFKKLVSLQPQNPDFYFELSQIYALMGNKEESELWNKKGQSLTKTIK